MSAAAANRALLQVKYLMKLMSLAAAALLVSSAGLTSPVFAQEPTASEESAGAQEPSLAQQEGRSGAWELNAFIGLLNDEPEWHPDAPDDQFRRDAIIGVRAGYTFPFGLLLQAEGANSLVRVSLPDGNGDRARNVNVFFIEGVLGYDIALSQKAELFLVGGAGVAICAPDGMDSETDFALNYGLGGRYFLSPKLALRGDVRMHQIFDAFAETRERILVDPVREDLFALELSIGVSYFIGRR
ncbi:MAG: outer membrane beta-barrel protein [Acidimicrobiia bacterium]